jgi:hypothetical protein
MQFFKPYSPRLLSFKFEATAVCSTPHSQSVVQIEEINEAEGSADDSKPKGQKVRSA